MLRICSLSFEYDEKLLFDDLNFILEPGQLMHLKGCNGAGKTTLLRLLAGILQPASGEIFFDSQSIEKNRIAYQQQLCFVGHKTGLNSMLSIRENCYFDTHYHSTLNFDNLLQQFKLEKFADTLCQQLSAGQKRRAALLRIAMTQARLWLLDEPFTALDEQSTALLVSCLRNHLKTGGLIVMTSHQQLPNTIGAALEYEL